MSCAPDPRARSARPAPRAGTKVRGNLPPLLPRRLLEHFRPVPGQELRLRQAFFALRLNRPGAVVGEQLRLGVVAARQVEVAAAPSLMPTG